MKPTILVVDDEPNVRYGICRALENGYRTVEADSAEAARAALAREMPHLVLLDLVMPGEGGLSFLRWLRELESPPPVIVVSALDTAKTAVEALQLGAADYLVKGFDIVELRRRVGNQLRLVELDEENTRLTRRVAREEARMERELHAARCLQAVLLPRVPTADCGLDVAARYVAARELGGDLYEFLRYEPQHWAFALGDVSGKGAAAALYGAMAMGILRSLAPLKFAPAEMLRRLNALICEQGIADRFLTMCFATWEPARRQLRVANAGHPPLLLCRQGRCEEIWIEGLPVGIFGDASYTEWAAVLQPADILVLYSDGITESTNPSDDAFGAERLRSVVEANAALSASALADCLLQELERFAGGTPAADDRTLLVARVP